MSRKFVVSMLVISLAVALPGCSWSDLEREERGAIIGAGAGAGLGALIGAVTGSWAWGAIIGAAGGALAGYVIADITEEDRPAVSGDAQLRRDEADRYFQQAMAATSSSESERLLNRSIEAYPTPQAYNNLGLLHLQAGDRARAEQAWQSALQLDPNNKAARDNLNMVRGGRAS